VPTAMVHRLVTSSMTSRNSITSNSWRHNVQSRRIRKLGPGSTVRVNHLRPLYRRTLCLKISSFVLELLEKKHLVRRHSDKNSAKIRLKLDSARATLPTGLFICLFIHLFISETAI